LRSKPVGGLFHRMKRPFKTSLWILHLGAFLGLSIKHGEEASKKAKAPK
jgi:hypothetical protein